MCVPAQRLHTKDSCMLGPCLIRTNDNLSESSVPSGSQAHFLWVEGNFLWTGTRGSYRTPEFLVPYLRTMCFCVRHQNATSRTLWWDVFECKLDAVITYILALVELRERSRSLLADNPENTIRLYKLHFVGMSLSWLQRHRRLSRTLRWSSQKFRVKLELIESSAAKAAH